MPRMDGLCGGDLALSANYLVGSSCRSLSRLPMLSNGDRARCFDAGDYLTLSADRDPEIAGKRLVALALAARRPAIVVIVY